MEIQYSEIKDPLHSRHTNILSSPKEFLGELLIIIESCGTSYMLRRLQSTWPPLFLSSFLSHAHCNDDCKIAY